MDLIQFPKQDIDILGGPHMAVEGASDTVDGNKFDFGLNETDQ